MIKKLKSMDAYPTAHLKYVMDSEWDILQALRTLMKKLTTTDSSTSATTWNTPDNSQFINQKQSDTEDTTNTETISDSDTQPSEDASTSDESFTTTRITIPHNPSSPTTLEPTNEELIHTKHSNDESTTKTETNQRLGYTDQ